MQTEKKIWIIDPYGEIPSSGWRDGRYFLMAEQLTTSGYEVIQFISNFSHRTKNYVFKGDEDFLIQNIQFIIVASSSYTRNISLSRIQFESTFIKTLLKRVENFDKPDCIILRDPALFYSMTIVNFCKKNSIKLVVDVIDLWPELFELILPSYLRFFGRLIFLPLYMRRKWLFKNADALVAVSPDYLEVAKKIQPDIPSEVIYWGCNLGKMREIIDSTSENVLDEFRLEKHNGDFWIIYAGSLGEYYDLTSIVSVAKKFAATNPNVKFFIAGSGPMEKWINKYIKFNNPSNLFYLGSLKTDVLFNFFKFCDIGLCTYSNCSTVSMPIKCYDYFAAGLPVINSLGRNLKKIIKEKQLGLQYIAEDTESLTTAIEKLVSDDMLYSKMRYNVLKQSEIFDEKIQYFKINELVNSLFRC